MAIKIMFYFKSIRIETPKENLISITHKVREIVFESGSKQGICVVYCPHTTAGITVNESADPDVVLDILMDFNRVYPDNRNFKHFEGNSAAHIKSSVMGCEKTFIIENGEINLGRWQNIYFCEFDGPRQRRVDIAVYGV